MEESLKTDDLSDAANANRKPLVSTLYTSCDLCYDEANKEHYLLHPLRQGSVLYANISQRWTRSFEGGPDSPQVSANLLIYGA